MIYAPKNHHIDFKLGIELVGKRSKSMIFARESECVRSFFYYTLSHDLLTLLTIKNGLEKQDLPYF